jgi:hypothetical protein
MNRSDNIKGLQAVIEKKVPSMKKDFYRDAQIIGKCPICNSTLVCLYDDLGATEYYDNYCHLCLNPNCEYCVHKELFGLNNGLRTDDQCRNCIFCGREVNLTF